MAPLACVPATRPPLGEAWFSVLDVGQGLATVLRTTHHTLVYDTGPGRPGGYDAGAAVVVPFLRYWGVQQIDTLMVSHADNDHSGGAPSIRATLHVDRLLGGIQGAEPCVRGMTWNWDGIDFRVIHPTADTAFVDNDASCVLRVAWPGGSLLLTGDIGHAAEHQLLLHTPEDLPATIIVAPHHGSHAGSTLAFVNTVAPQMVIYATGYRNRYHFPNPEVVARYAAVGATSFNTAQQGTLDFQLRPNRPTTVQSWRFVARHYWHFPIPPDEGVQTPVD